jgi:CheY-like chemotaxis protein
MSETVRLLERPILLAASEPDDVWIARAALERVGWSVAPAEDAVAGMQALCDGAGQFAAVVVGERVGRVSGLTFCGLARDAGCTLPALLLTADAHAAIAVRAARLHVTVLWHPVSPRQLERALRGLLPRRRCALPGAALEGAPCATADLNRACRALDPGPRDPSGSPRAARAAECGTPPGAPPWSGRPWR